MATMEHYHLKALCRDIRGVLGHKLIWTALAPGIAFAGPTGESVVAGSAAVSRPDANTTHILQSTQSAIIDWKQFSVGTREFVEFFQPQTSSVILNRVVGPDHSNILGHLSANGRVFLVNPHGVYFGPGAHVDVGGLVATTLDIKNEDFLSGNYEFVKLPDMEVRGEVVNEGVIRARDNGFVVLAGDYAKNTGVISARLGTVALGAGSRMTLDVNGTGLVSYVVDEATVSELAGVENTGALFADGGRVIMTAKVAEGLIGSAVNQQGLVQARSISTARGKIILGAEGGDITNGGTLDVSAVQGSGADGGVVSIRGTGNIEQSGAIHADGEGSGGSVRLVADGDLKVRESSRISATGKQRGGLVEVSGHGALSLRGGIVIGRGGRLIIDPTDLIIANGTGAATSNTIFEQFIEGQLQSGASVQAVASRSITINNLADNTLNGQNTSGSGGSLILGIGSISSSIFNRGSGSGNGAITMADANDTILLDGSFTASGGSTAGDATLGNVSAGGITVNAAGNITAGNLSAQASSGRINMSLSAGGSLAVAGISASASTSAMVGIFAVSGITLGGVSVSAGGGTADFSISGAGSVTLNGAVNLSASGGSLGSAHATLAISNVTGSVAVNGPVNIQASGSSSATASFSLTSIGGAVNLAGDFSLSASGSSARAVGFIQNNLPGLITVSGNNVFTANGRGGASLIVNNFSGGVVISGNNRFTHNASSGQVSAGIFVGTGSGNVSITGNNSFSGNSGSGSAHWTGIQVDGVNGNVTIGAPGDVMTYQISAAGGTSIAAGIKLTNIGGTGSPAVVIDGTHNITASGSGSVRAGVLLQQDSIGASSLSVSIPGRINASASATGSGGKALASIGINGINVGHVSVSGNNVMTALATGPGGSARADIFLHSFQGGASVTGNNAFTAKGAVRASAGISFGSSLGPSNAGNVSVSGANTMLANAGSSVGTSNDAEAFIGVYNLSGNVSIAGNQAFTASSGTFAGAPQSAGAGISLDSVSGNIIVGAGGDLFTYRASGGGGGSSSSSASPGVAAGVAVRNFGGSTVSVRGTHNIITHASSGFIEGGFDFQTLNGGDVDIGANLNVAISGSASGGRAGVHLTDAGSVTLSGNYQTIAAITGSPSINFAGIQIGDGSASGSATGPVSIGGNHTHTNSYSGSSAATAGLRVFAQGPVTLSGNQKYAIATNGKAEVIVQTPTHITVNGTVNADPVAVSGDNVAVIKLSAGTSGTTGDLLINSTGALTASAQAAAGVFLGAGHDVTVNGPITVKTSGSGSTFTSFGSGLQRGMALLQFQPVGNNLQVNAPLTVTATHQRPARALINVLGVGGNANLIGGGQVLAVNTGGFFQQAQVDIGSVGGPIGGDVNLGGNWSVRANGPSGSDGSAQVLIDRVGGNVNVTGTGTLIATGTSGSGEASFTVRNVTGNVGINANYNYTGSATPSDETIGARLNISNVGGNVAVAGNHVYTAIANGTDSAFVSAGLFINNVNTGAGSTVTVSGTQTINATGNSSLNSLSDGVFISGARDVTVSANVTVDVTASDSTNGENIGIFVNNARNVTVSGNNTITLTGVSGNNDVGLFLGSGSFNRNSGSISVLGNNTITNSHSSGAGPADMQIWAAGPVTVMGNQVIQVTGGGSGSASFHVDVLGSANIHPSRLDILAGGSSEAWLQVSATGPINPGGAPIAARLDGPIGGAFVVVNDPVSLVLNTRAPDVDVSYPAQVMAGNLLTINNNGFLAPASFTIGAVSGGSFGQVNILTGGTGALNSNINASRLTFAAGGDANVAGRSFMTSGLTNLSAGGNLLFGGMNAVAGNIVMTAGGNVDDQVNAATLSADGLFLGAGGNITTGVSSFNVGGGLSGAQGDPVMLAALQGTTIPPFSADPNAAFIAPGQVDIGNLNLSWNGVDASHVLYQGAMIRQLGAVSQPNPDLVVQFTPFDPTATIGVEQNAPGVCGGPACGLDLSANGLFNKFSGTTVVIGNADQTGMITIGQNGPVSFGSAATQNVAFMTAGGFDNIDGLNTGNLQTAFAVEPDNLGQVMTSGIVLVIDPVFSSEPIVSPGQVAGTLGENTPATGTGAGEPGTEPVAEGGDEDTGSADDTGDDGGDDASDDDNSDDEGDDNGDNGDEDGGEDEQSPADEEAANASGECF